MIVQIENGGLDLSLYNVSREYKETNSSFESKLAAAKTQIFLDLAFFNTMLEVICMAVDEDDLRNGMRIAFENRAVKNRNNLKQFFGYTFGLLSGNNNLDKVDYMEVYQADNPNRIIYVEL